MTRPTEEAQRYFEHANMWLMEVVRAAMEGKNEPINTYHIAMGLTNMAYGMSHLSVGMRATYMKLEEIERLLKLPKL